ncbi:mono/diheme cytochrome c family protein [Skermanella aerolata]|uniref:c-type cytochrome n=1 Tax=Skermanella aerolata TaxID=393310 RepID=UPI003D1CDBF2
MRTFMIAAAGTASLLLCPVFTASQAFSAEEKVKRGEYLAAIMDCGGCHTTGALLGKPDPTRHLGGSEVGFQLPGVGTFYPPNLTPEPETGIGRWSEADIVRAVRTGVRPDGRILAPVMPYHSYGKLTDADAQALASYLRSLNSVRNRVPELAGPSEKPTAPYLGVMMPD